MERCKWRDARVYSAGHLVVGAKWIGHGHHPAVWIQRLPQRQKSVDIGMVQPEHWFEGCHLWELHVAKASNAIVNAIVNGFDIVGDVWLTSRCRAGKGCEVGDAGE